MMLDESLQAYLDGVASAAPSPGAGSVAGVIGALGCALGEMVCGITIAKPGQSADPRLVDAQSTLSANRPRLTELAAQDAIAYQRYTDARAMPRDNNDQRRGRSRELRERLAEAAEVPLSIAETCATALEATITIAELGSRYTLADVSTAAYALEAAARGALENVWVNIGLMKDEEAAERFRSRADEALLRSSLAIHQVITTVDERSAENQRSK
jgi:formiminotetrahydrofolate cyclodeaminase